MLYTKKGDDGKTGLFHCDQRMSKSSAVAEALGSLDELCSFLGVIKAQINQGLTMIDLQSIIHGIQENLFIIQAEVAGAGKVISEEKIKEVGNLISEIEKEIPPITSFTIPGACLESAELDFARTLARKTERRVVAVLEENLVKISPETLAYLNRLSSLLYALARQTAYKSGVREDHPSY